MQPVDMTNSMWAALGALLGALIGGGISLTTQRASESAAAKRHAETLREARRPERLTHLVAFLQIAQEVERVAKYIHHDGRTDLRERADAILDELWIKLRPVQMLCSKEVATTAHALAVRTHVALREGSGQQPISEFLRPSRHNLINAARVDLDAGEPFMNWSLVYPRAAPLRVPMNDRPPIAAAIIVDDGRVLLVRRRVEEGLLSWQFP